MCISSLLYVLTSREHPLAMWRVFSKSHFTSQPSPWVSPSPVLPWKRLLFPAEQKSLKAKYKRGTGYWHLSLYSCLYQKLRDTFFCNISTFHWSFGVESTTQHCWSLLCPVGHENREPRRHDLKLKNMLLPFSSLCRHHICTNFKSSKILPCL